MKRILVIGDEGIGLSGLNHIAKIAGEELVLVDNNDKPIYKYLDESCDWRLTPQQVSFLGERIGGESLTYCVDVHDMITNMDWDDILSADECKGNFAKKVKGKHTYPHWYKGK